jgi:predicted RNA-binding Zn-ribbon protein involved in translation (DUF1610 family)
MFNKINQLLKKLRWSSASSKSVKACPRCRSTKIMFSSKFDSWLTPKRYYCNNCTYVGPIILEVEEQAGKN